MALLKAIRQDDGVTTAYHRIAYIQSTINKHISIAVLSYIDEDSRRSISDGAHPYTTAVVYEKEYEENMTIETAYSYLKTLTEFEDAEDVLENKEENQNGE